MRDDAKYSWRPEAEGEISVRRRMSQRTKATAQTTELRHVNVVLPLLTHF